MSFRSDMEIQEFELILRAEGKKPKTIRTYTDAARWLEKSYGELEKVTRMQIREHITTILGDHSPAYASNQFRALQAYYKRLEDEDGIKSPMTGLKPPTVPLGLVPVVSEGDLESLLGTCQSKRFNDLRDRAILMFFVSTGCRRSEVSNLRITDIDLDQLCAVVTGKASKMRVVRFDAQTALAIVRYLKARKSRKHAGSEFLWIGGYGPLTSDGMYQMFQRRAQAAGVTVHPHQLRHTFSHRWLSNGGNETDLMQQAGWNSAQMLRRYGASAASERARQAYDRVMGI